MMEKKIEQVVADLCDMISAHKATGGVIDDNVACTASAVAQLAQIATGHTNPVHKKETADVTAVVNKEFRILELTRSFLSAFRDIQNGKDIDHRLAIVREAATTGLVSAQDLLSATRGTSQEQS